MAKLKVMFASEILENKMKESALKNNKEVKELLIYTALLIVLLILMIVIP